MSDSSGANAAATREAKDAKIPDYAPELSAFHRAFLCELRAVVVGLSVASQSRVLDVGCGDGFYTGLFAERLRSPGSITGFDSNAAYLKLARDRMASVPVACDVNFVDGRLDRIAALTGPFDVAWCAQSLFSLPEPIAALQQMSSVLRPGGQLVVLENDTMHQLLLPWPSRLELAVRKAEMAALCDQTPRPDKYYVGRQLPELFVAAGLEPLGIRTQCIDRHVPFGNDLTEFLTAYLSRLSHRVCPYLDRASRDELLRFVAPQNDASLVNQPFANITWLNMLAWARK